MSRFDLERTAEINARADEISALQVGDGVTVSVWSDMDAYTIVKKTEKTLTLRQDKAVRDPNWKPEFIVGGFAGHCVNQNEQTYTYQPDEDGAVVKVSLRQWIGPCGTARRMWKRAGVRTGEQGGNVYAGRRAFHDFNF